jgi:hypothetical protein
VLYLALWASPISSFQMRFLMPIVPGLALIGAAGLGWLLAGDGMRARFRRGALVGAIVVLAAMNLPPFMRFHEVDRVGWDGWLTHVVRVAPWAVVAGRESESAYLARTVPSFRAWQAVNARLPLDARILTFSGGDRLYTRRQYVPYDSAMAQAAVFTPALEWHRAATALRALRITHVLFDRRELDRVQGATLAIGSPAIQQACTTEYDDRRFWICRLDYARLLPETGVRPAASSSGLHATRRSSSGGPAGPHLPGGTR